MISIITVNWNSYDFLYLLVESLERFSSIPYELIVIDNSEDRLRVNDNHVYQFLMPKNIGHGRGLNNGVAKAQEMFPRNPYVMFLDVDCHFVSYGWEFPLIKSMQKFDLVGGRGVRSKPIRPACMFMKKELAKYDWADSTGYRGNRVTPEGYDVAIKAYYKIQADGFNVGFIEPTKSQYATLNGEEYVLDNQRICYHHWHGSCLEIPERQQDFPGKDLVADKAELFSRIPWRLP